MKQPIDLLLDNVSWAETDVEPSGDDMPYATHSGVLDIAGISIRCYRLSSGQAVFDGDDIKSLFGLGS